MKTMDYWRDYAVKWAKSLGRRPKKMEATPCWAWCGRALAPEVLRLFPIFSQLTPADSKAELIEKLAHRLAELDERANNLKAILAIK